MKFIIFLLVILLSDCLFMQKDKNYLVHTKISIEDLGICKKLNSIYQCLKHVREERAAIAILNNFKSGKVLEAHSASCNEFIFLKVFTGNFLKLNKCNFQDKISISYDDIPFDEIIVFHSIETEFNINPLLEIYNATIASFWEIPAPWYYHHQFRGQLSIVKIEELEKFLKGKNSDK